MKRSLAGLILVLGMVVPILTVNARVEASQQYLWIPVESDMLTLRGSWAGSAGLRSEGDSGRFGLAPNQDYAHRGMRSCDVAYGRVPAGTQCILQVVFENKTAETIPSSSIRLEWDYGGDNRGFVSRYPSTNSMSISPGGEMVWDIMDSDLKSMTYTFDIVGSLRDRARVVSSATGNIISSFDLDYEVYARLPSAPSSGLVQFTENTLSVAWIDPLYDGGSPITGWLVYLFPIPEPGTYNYNEGYTASPKTLACNFTGRPELRICDVPNNQLGRVEPGEYRFIVMALNAVAPGPASDSMRFLDSSVGAWWWSDTFTVDDTLGVTPPPEPEPVPLPEPEPDPTPEPEPEPTPTPTPTPDPTPGPGPEVIILVPDYSVAPNLVSLIHATNYSNDLDAPVLRLYQAYFNREPDLLGTKYWLDVRRSGHRQLAIAGFMAGSREFANNYEGVSDREYLTRVYRNMLGRDYDQAGFNYWLDAVRGTNDFGGNPRYTDLTRAEVVFYVTGGEEFIRNYPYTK